MSRELKSIDIAERHGVSRTTAYRWLLEIEKQYGSRVVTRRGRVLVTTEDAFAQVAPLVAQRGAEERRFRDLEEEVADAHTRLNKAVEEIGTLRREFQALSARWFARAI